MNEWENMNSKFIYPAQFMESKSFNHPEQQKLFLFLENNKSLITDDRVTFSLRPCSGSGVCNYKYEMKEVGICNIKRKLRGMKT